MNIVVNATALRTSGAKTIILQFIKHAHKDRANNYYLFIPDSLEYESVDNLFFIKIAQQGWLKRIRWDSHGLVNECRKKNIIYDIVISLQNTSVNTEKKQYIYVHQSLPFSDIAIPLTNMSNLKLFLYKHIYFYFIKRFVADNTHFFVQTQWVEDALKKKIGNNNITIIKPDYTISKNVIHTDQQKKHNNEYVFIYPATPLIYKNHLMLLDVIEKVKQKNIGKITLKITFSLGQYKKFDKELIRRKLTEQVEYLGVLNKDDLIQEYINSDIVLFPSYVESFGLPLAESASLNKKIVASDLPYAKEVLKGYDKVCFAHYNKPDKWVNCILHCLSDSNNLNNSTNYNSLIKEQLNSHNSWVDFFKIISHSK